MWLIVATGSLTSHQVSRPSCVPLHQMVRDNKQRKFVFDQVATTFGCEIPGGVLWTHHPLWEQLWFATLFTVSFSFFSLSRWNGCRQVLESTYSEFSVSWIIAYKWAIEKTDYTCSLTVVNHLKSWNFDALESSHRQSACPVGSPDLLVTLCLKIPCTLSFWW